MIIYPSLTCDPACPGGIIYGPVRALPGIHYIFGDYRANLTSRINTVKKKGVIMKMGSRVKTANIIAFLSVWMVLLVLGSVYAAMQADVPRISIEELNKMIEDKTPVTIIDVQPKDIYESGHIKGAISIPWKSQIALEDVWSLPSDQLTVTYCDCGPGESDSADVANQLSNFGFDNVKVLRDPSIRGWKELKYPMEKKQ